MSKDYSYFVAVPVEKCFDFMRDNEVWIKNKGPMVLTDSGDLYTTYEISLNNLDEYSEFTYRFLKDGLKEE